MGEVSERSADGGGCSMPFRYGKAPIVNAIALTLPPKGGSDEVAGVISVVKRNERDEVAGETK